MADYFYSMTALLVHHVAAEREAGRMGYEYCEDVLWTVSLLQGEENH